MLYKWEINYNYKQLDEKTFSDFAQDVVSMLNITHVIIKNPKGINEPYISKTLVGLNGDYFKHEHHESLMIKGIVDPKTRVVDVATGYGQCDTGDKPYDTVVAATLLMFKHYFPTQVKLYPAKVNDNWKKGYDLAEQVITPLESLEELIDA